MIDPPQLRRSDLALLTVCWLAVSLPAVLIPHTPVGEEAAIVQAARDLNTSSHLLANSEAAPEATLSTTPLWLARLTFFIGGAGIEVLMLRSLSTVAGLLTVLLSGALAARWFGRRTGLLAGLVATTTTGLSASVWHSGEPIWLGVVVLVAVYLFSEIEFPSGSADQDSAARSQAARVRRRMTAGLVVWLGMAVVLAGPTEVGILIGLPLAAYLSRQRRQATLQILSLRGWLIVAGFLVTAFTFDQLPGWSTQLTVAEIVDSAGRWESSLTDGPSRIDRLAELSRTVLPWGLLVPFGLWLMRHEALAVPRSRERLLLCLTVISPLVSVLLFPTRPDLILASCIGWSIPAAVTLNHIWLVTTTGQLRRRDTLIPVSRIGFSTAALLCVLTGLVGEWSRPELLDEDFMILVESQIARGERLHIDVDARDRPRVLVQFEDHSISDADLKETAGSNASRLLIVSSPRRIKESMRHRRYRKLLESRHRAGQSDCLTLYEIESSQKIAARPSEIR